ncbi:glycosaminoglycan xylosylkinase homolog [Phlebotomus argentipes]|uniref:glycosaminoglycan xylosylkinase homolog n=1 Tax=Phlebotomus argentipes TaxID=94469 RepID=UPI0028936FC7|nr:glycosaminoglycan xylosylkinase homolog [Phlebotomus argentipes]
MIRKRICLIAGLLVSLFLLIFSLNFYFLSRLNEQIAKKDLAKQQKVPKSGDFEAKIVENADNLEDQYRTRSPKYLAIRKELLKNLRPSNYVNISSVWNAAKEWVADNEIYPAYAKGVGAVVRALQQEGIVRAKNSPKGTQLKLMLRLAGSQIAIFKPKWYEKDAVFSGAVYSGKDRHTAEIVAFYLGAILNLRWTPIAVGRRIDMRDVYRRADKELKETMEVRNGSQYCVFGKCFYCRDTEAVCGEEESNELEGTLLLLVPGGIGKQRSPWQRTYKDHVKAQWEEDEEYCDTVKERMSMTRLLDLIDAAVFDFLIQNGDRHHYETRNERLLLMDNGKGFGNPGTDFIDILAPLYQCCLIRKSTWHRLKMFSGGSLTETLEDLTKYDLLYPILTEEHFEAVERRLLLVYSTVEGCLQKHGESILR